MNAQEGIQVNGGIVRGNLIWDEKPGLTVDNVHVLEQKDLKANDGLRCLVLKNGIALPILYTRDELEAAGVELHEVSDVQAWSLVHPETDEHKATIAPEFRNARDLVLAVLKSLDPDGRHHSIHIDKGQGVSPPGNP